LALGPAKEAEPIEMPLGWRLGWAQGNVLHGDPHPHWKGQFLWRAAHSEVQERSAVGCAKTGEPILAIYTSMTFFSERI